eukprot:scaffold19701_cov101-Skeletonema_dohrnii-CCMP3373.AAC.1
MRELDHCREKCREANAISKGKKYITMRYGQKNSQSTASREIYKCDGVKPCWYDKSRVQMMHSPTPMMDPSMPTGKTKNLYL